MQYTLGFIAGLIEHFCGVRVRDAFTDLPINKISGVWLDGFDDGIDLLMRYPR